MQRASTHARVSDHAGWDGARDIAPPVLPSALSSASAPESKGLFAAQWLAYALPCRRFADTLAEADARLGADVDRYSFIAVDLHHLLFAGFDRRTDNVLYQLVEYSPIAVVTALRCTSCQMRWQVVSSKYGSANISQGPSQTYLKFSDHSVSMSLSVG